MVKIVLNNLNDLRGEEACFFVFSLQLIHNGFHTFFLLLHYSPFFICKFKIVTVNMGGKIEEPIITNAAEVVALLEIPVVSFKELQYSACCDVLSAMIATLLSTLR